MSEASEPIPESLSPEPVRRSIVRTINKATRDLHPVDHLPGKFVRSGQIVRSGRSGQITGLVRQPQAAPVPLQAAKIPQATPSRDVDSSEASDSKRAVDNAVAPVLSELTSPQERYDNASRRGYEDGYSKGIARAEEEMATERERQAAHLSAMDSQRQTLLDSLAQAVSVFDARVAEITTAISNELIAATFDLAEAMVGHELRHCPRHVAETVLTSLSTAGPGEVTVKVNPSDLEILQSQAPSDRKLHLIADSSVQVGGCLLDVGPRTVDARVNEVIARTKKAFLGESEP